MQRGFSLIQLSIILTIAALVRVATLPTIRQKPALDAATVTRMNAVMSALRQYQVSNGKLPCPADASQPVQGALYGVAAQNGGAAGNCTGGWPAANYVDSTNNVAIGMVPVRTLGLSNDFALDAYGREITYAVDTNATLCYSQQLPGTIAVTDNGVQQNSVVALVSHGRNGHGAWVPRNSATGSAVRLNAGSQDAAELTNAHLSLAFTPATPLNNFVKTMPTATFDDLVVYNNPAWNLANPSAAESAILPTLGVPASGTYINNQTLAFNLTYGTRLNVTGVPSIPVTIGSNERYASYVSGTGTNTLTFSYTLQAGNYAPGGISVGNILNQSSGSVSTLCTNYTVPPMAVLVKQLVIYVADFNNSRVQKFSSSGGYLSQFGSYGLLAGLFVHPYQLAIDGSGDVWVADFGNSRVQEFNSNGTYLSSFGSLGVGNGQFINVASVGVDASGNVWASDSGNDRVEKFNPAGTYLGQFGSMGTGNGQFLAPSGVAIDGSGNIWVGDWGNGRIEEFSSSGIYEGRIGSVGVGNGQFINPCGQAFDTSGNTWIADNGNSRIEKLSSSGAYLTKVGGWGTGNGQLINPCGIAIDVAGNIWVGDTGNNRIQKFSAAGTYLGQFGAAGAGNGLFSAPVSVGLWYQWSGPPNKAAVIFLFD